MIVILFILMRINLIKAYKFKNMINRMKFKIIKLIVTFLKYLKNSFKSQ